MNQDKALDILKKAAGARYLFIMLIGTPNSGKTRFAELLKTHFDLIHVNSDHTHTHVESRSGYINRSIDVAVRAFKHVVVDQTNLTHVIRRQRLNKVLHHYRVGIDLNTVPLEELYKRENARREDFSRHVPHKIIKQLWAEYEAPSATDGFDLILTVEA